MLGGTVCHYGTSGDVTATVRIKHDEFGAASQVDVVSCSEDSPRCVRMCFRKVPAIDLLLISHYDQENTHHLDTNTEVS